TACSDAPLGSARSMASRRITLTIAFTEMVGRRQLGPNFPQASDFQKIRTWCYKYSLHPVIGECGSRTADYHLLQLPTPSGTLKGLAWYPHGPKQLAELLRSAWSASPVSGSLTLPFPAEVSLPACGDSAFRAFAARLLALSPGISFFVLGGDSFLARELLLASLPNINAVCTNGWITVRFPVEEAQIVMMGAVESMIEAGIKKDAALLVVGRLASQIRMEEQHWA
ncbi:MAG: hypothetical protein JWM47_4577, partial [Acidimicrobiales bacterium]|nr:hypothetical protein [Acidimicrobiales bacterium]